MDAETTAQPANMHGQYYTNATNIHYTLHNLFRGLKSIWIMYTLTIYEFILVLKYNLSN